MLMEVDMPEARLIRPTLVLVADQAEPRAEETDITIVVELMVVMDRTAGTATKTTSPEDKDRGELQELSVCLTVHYMLEVVGLLVDQAELEVVGLTEEEDCLLYTSCKGYADLQ